MEIKAVKRRRRGEGHRINNKSSSVSSMRAMDEVENDERDRASAVNKVTMSGYGYS
jgi:hypothetical protein